MLDAPNCQCDPCMGKLKQTIDYAFKLCGGIGLFFSFTEVSSHIVIILLFYHYPKIVSMFICRYTI